MVLLKVEGRGDTFFFSGRHNIRKTINRCGHILKSSGSDHHGGSGVAAVNSYHGTLTVMLISLKMEDSEYML